MKLFIYMNRGYHWCTEFASSCPWLEYVMDKRITFPRFGSGRACKL